MTEIKEFIWKIENVSMFSGGFALRSAEISVGIPHHSNWYLELELHDSGDRQFLYTAKRTSGSFDVKCAYEISIVCPESHKHVPDDNSHLNRFAFVIQECCLNCCDTLTLKCRLMFNDVSFQHIASATELSKNISSLYESKKLSDLTLHANNKEFFLHKFLICKRAPKLFEELKLNDGKFKNGRVKIDTISTSMIEILVQYLYSGKLDTFIPEENLLEFFEMSEKYMLERSSAKNLPLESFTSICTRINVEKRIISWNNKPLNDKSPFFEYFIHFDCARFLISAWFERYPLKCIKINIQCISVVKECIVLLFSLSLGKNEDNLLLQIRKYLRFASQRKSGKPTPNLFSVPCTQNLFNKTFSAKLVFEVSTGEFNTYSLSGTPSTQTDYSSVFGMGVLRHDISSLYHEAQMNNSNEDVTLIFEDESINTVLFAHKAILAAWSPVFSSMFDHNMLEKENNEVIIPDISFETGKRLLFFMYSGEITKTTCEEDMQIYAAADKYQISSLFKQCSAFLTDHLKIENACDILVLADQHSDENLSAVVQRYIGSNRSVIMGSSKWLSLIDMNPRLISQVLRGVSDDLLRE